MPSKIEGLEDRIEELEARTVTLAERDIETSKTVLELVRLVDRLSKFPEKISKIIEQLSAQTFAQSDHLSRLTVCFVNPNPGPDDTDLATIESVARGADGCRARLNSFNLERSAAHNVLATMQRAMELPTQPKVSDDDEQH